MGTARILTKFNGNFLKMKNLTWKTGGYKGVMLFPSHILLIINKDTMTFYLCPYDLCYTITMGIGF